MSDVMRKEYRQLTDDEKAHIKRIKDLGERFIDECRSSEFNMREFALARTKIEEAVMWAVKGITG